MRFHLISSIFFVSVVVAIQESTSDALDVIDQLSSKQRQEKCQACITALTTTKTAEKKLSFRKEVSENCLNSVKNKIVCRSILGLITIYFDVVPIPSMCRAMKECPQPNKNQALAFWKFNENIKNRLIDRLEGLDDGLTQLNNIESDQ